MCIRDRFGHARARAFRCGPVLPSIAAGCRLTNSMVAMDEPARLAHADVNGSNACARRGPARLSTVSASRYESAFSCCVRTPRLTSNLGRGAQGTELRTWFEWVKAHRHRERGRCEASHQHPQGKGPREIRGGPVWCCDSGLVTKGGPSECSRFRNSGRSSTQIAVEVSAAGRLRRGRPPETRHSDR